jgi:predicted SnoaL-like aldol condensation-catalyzing enzyme
VRRPGRSLPFPHPPEIRLNKPLSTLFLACTFALPAIASAQVAVQASPNQEQLLASKDARLAANKRLVYDFWREVLEGGHLELADKFLTESYIQHNPNVPTGRAGFVKFFSQFAKAKPIDAHVKAPLVSIVADGNLVVMSFVNEQADPKDPKKTYTTTSFDMFRIEGGKIAEHWDADTRQ